MTLGSCLKMGILQLLCAAVCVSFIFLEFKKDE